MKEYVIPVVIPKDRKITIQAPPDAPEGEAEVVLKPKDPETGNGQTLSDFLEMMQKSDHKRYTKEELDARIKEERDSWD